jgi:hypothetical protein
MQLLINLRKMRFRLPSEPQHWAVCTGLQLKYYSELLPMQQQLSLLSVYSWILIVIRGQ